MLDHTFVDDNGNRCPISKLDTATIVDCLQNGFAILKTDGESDPERMVRERLEIELVARRIRL